MLQLQIEVRTIQFLINSMSESCSMQFIHNQSSTLLKSLLKCRCRDIQEINESIELNIQYVEKEYLKLQIQDNQIIIGEATINLGFYIENSLPVIIDNITIQSKYDQEAYVEMSLGWNMLEQIQTKQIQSFNHLREQAQSIKVSQQNTCKVSNLSQEHPLEQKKIDQFTITKKNQLEIKQEQFDQKYMENGKKCQLEDEKVEDIPKTYLQTASSLRFQTPIDCKLTKKQKTQKSSIILENYKGQINNKHSSDCKPNVKEQGQKIRQKSQNRLDSRIKGRVETQQVEQGDTFKRATKSRLLCKQADDNIKQSLKNQEAGYFTSRQLEQDKGNQEISIQQLQNDIQLLKNLIQQMYSENQSLKEQLMKSEATFNLLSETYTSLRNEYKKIQLKNYDSTNNTLMINKEYEYIKKELDQKQREIEFIQKESQLWKIELEIIKRENQQIQKDFEQTKKELINKQLENNNLIKDVEIQRSKISVLEKELQLKKQVNQSMNQDINLQIYTREFIGSNENSLEQIKNDLKKQKIEIDNNNEKLKQTKLQQQLLQLEEGNKKLEFSEEIDKMNLQLQKENEMLKQKLNESYIQIQSKTLENEKLKAQINIYLQSPDKQNLDLTYLINEYSNINASLKQENQNLIHQNKKDQVKLESLQKQLGINKNIVDLSEQRQQSLEQEILQLEKAVLSGKQNMADVINAVLECGGPDLAEAVERFLIIRRSTKIS